MNKSYITKTRKKKLTKPMTVYKDPQEIAQDKLIQISNQINPYEINIENTIDKLLKDDQIQLKQEIQKNNKKSKSLDHKYQIGSQRNCQFSDYFKQKFNIIQSSIDSRYVFVGTKNALTVTNYLIMGEKPSSIFQKINSPQNRIRYPSSIKNLIRKKSFSEKAGIANDLKNKRNIMDKALNTNRVNFSAILKSSS